MPLAAPLILPFAELAGITIAGLGMAAASKKVSDFISENPEISTQILTTLVPGGVGLNALFKDKDAPSTKDIVLGELGKEKGNYSSPDAEGAYSSKRGRIIKALEEAGKIKKGPDKDYDSSKKYKGYKKFYEKADGGAIGIEVLFEEKKDGGRIGYQSGGGLMDIETEFGLQAPKGTISFDDYLGGLYNSDKVGALQNLAVKDYAQGDYTKTATGPISDFRHQAAMNELSKSFSPGLVPNIIGDTIAFGAGLINEIPALGRGVNRENLREIGEDIVSNFKGTYGTSNKRTPEEIYDSIFNPRTTVVSSPNLTYGTAAAADFQDGQMLQPNVVPERIAPATYYNSAPNFNADVLREEEDAQYNLPKTNGIINSLLNMKSTVPQMLLSAATKVPGAGLVLGGLSSLSNLIGNSFENRQLTGEGVIVDEFGRSYDADELNAQNALGGYYTDAARSSRRRDSRIQNMLARQAAGKTISQNNLIALQEQAAREQAARETATAALAAQNASTYGTSEATGGYQSSWGGVDSFMSGSGTAADMGSFADGGRIGYVGGGLATTQDYATALSKVGAGTQAQKNRQVQDYARNEASNQIANAIRQGGQSSLNSYLTNVFGQTLPSYNATPSGKYANYNSPFTGSFNSVRNIMIDDVARQLVQKQAPSFYVDPKASASETYGKMMQQKTEEAYGTPDKYRAEAMTLGMPVEAYYDYLTTRDDKNIMQQYRKQDPYFEPSTYVPFTEADRTSSPYDIYFQQILQQQIDAGVPEEGRIQSGEVALPSMISPTTTGAAPRPFMSYSDALAQTRQSLGLANGGLATLFSMKR
jgi:hypothetical protein